MWRSALGAAARERVGAGARANEGAAPFAPAGPLGPRRGGPGARSRDQRSAPFGDVLELHACAYNIPPAFASSTPRLFCALLVPCQPDPDAPWYRRVRRGAVSPRTERRHMWRVAGVTEPRRVALGAAAVRFCVPLHLTGLAGTLDKVHRDALARRRASVAVFAIPDADDADEIHVAADENVPTRDRPSIPASRLDDFVFLGEAKLRLADLAVNARAGGGRSGHESTRHRFAIARSDAGGRGHGEPLENPAHARASKTIALELLAAVPAAWPRPGPERAGRYVGRFSVSFAPVRVRGSPEEELPVERVHLRLLRWVGDGYQPVFCTSPWSDDDPPPAIVRDEGAEARIDHVNAELAAAGRGGGQSSARRRDRAAADADRFFPAAPRRRCPLPVAHVPAQCLRGGGASAEDDGEWGVGDLPDGGFERGWREEGEEGNGAREEEIGAREAKAPSLLPRADVSWRLELVARTYSGRDVLVGWLDTTPGALEAAGAAIADAGERARPIAFPCEWPGKDGGESDFEAAALDASAGEAPPTLWMEKWALRPGRETGRLRPPGRRGEAARGGVASGKGRVARREEGEGGDGGGGGDGGEGGDGGGEKARRKEARERDTEAASAPIDDSRSFETRSKLNEKAERTSARERDPEAAGAPNDDARWFETRSKLRSSATSAPARRERSPPRTLSPQPPAHPPARDRVVLREGLAPSRSPARSRARAPPRSPGGSPDEKAGSRRRALLAAMTPTRALLERHVRVVSSGAKSTVAHARAIDLDRVANDGFPGGGVAPVVRAAGAVFPGETVPPATSPPPRGRRGVGAKLPSPPSPDPLASPPDPSPPSPPPAAETNFVPDPALIAAADAAVREAVDERLREQSAAELIDAALKVRRELLLKLNGELRYLEQRARREGKEKERAREAEARGRARARARR